MLPRRLSIISAVSAVVFLAGCETAPAPAPAPAKPAAPMAAAPKADRVYSNMTVSDVKGVSAPFETAPGTIFPENKMGYHLVLATNVSMPNLVATELNATEILVQARVYNRSDEPQVLDITFAVGEDHSTYHAHGVYFPAKRARDIKFTLSQQATQGLALIVKPSK